MSIDQQYLWDVLNSVWEEGLTEFEVQRRYFSILEKELKGEERAYLIEVYNHIEELELKEDSETILTNFYKEK